MLCCQLNSKDFKSQISKSLKHFFQIFIGSNHNQYKGENKAKTYQPDTKRPEIL
jgi:hypothetical protein